MNLVILDWTDNSMQVIRNIPEDICGEKLDKFVVEKCHCDLGSVEYMLIENEDPLIFKTYYLATDSVLENVVDYFGQHF